MKSCPGSKKASEHDTVIAFIDEAKCQLRANLHHTWRKVVQTLSVVGESGPESIKLIGTLTSGKN